MANKKLQKTVKQISLHNNRILKLDYMKQNNVVNETAIAEKQGRTILWPVCPFSVDDIGIGKDIFITNFAPSFENLAWDFYEMKVRQIQFLLNIFPEKENELMQFFNEYYHGGKSLSDICEIINLMVPETFVKFKNILPVRKRSIAQFSLFYSNGTWEIEREMVEHYSQMVSSEDYRSQKRIFLETDQTITSNPQFIGLLQWIGTMVRRINCKARKLTITFHQMRSIVRPGETTVIVPEGIHQDGVDYTIPAISIARNNISGGESIVYGDDKITEYWRESLEPGCGTFHSDKGSGIWHFVSPISTVDQTRDGWRDIFGFDTVIEERTLEN